QSRAFLSRGEPMNARITVYRQRTNSTYRRSVTWFVRNTKQPLRNILSPASESFERLASAPRRDPRRRLSAHARSRTAAAPECRPVGPLSGTPSPLRSVRRPRRENRGVIGPRRHAFLTELCHLLAMVPGSPMASGRGTSVGGGCHGQSPE